MKIVRLSEIVGTDRDVEGPGWKSRRLLLKKDGMGFSFHETLIPPGAELRLWYKNHLEAVYCVAGDGSIENLATGEIHEISDGTLYALNAHDRHVVRGGSKEMRLVCAFNPPVTGRETHDADGSYTLVDD
ncbi:MAG: L-ectoine synthase [Hyphomicrobiaceae bacterium]|jgi:L-ectoine synthase